MISTNLGQFPEEMLGLVDLLALIEKPYRNKIFRIAEELEITKPEQFRRHPISKLLAVGKIGQKCITHLRIGLVRHGYPFYPDDAIPELEKLLNSTRSLSQTRSIVLRFKILSRDNFTCKYCGRSPRHDDAVVLHVDHVTPLSRGGTWDESNLITSCRECNLGKKDILL